MKKNIQRGIFVFLIFILWNVGVFIGSLISGTEDQPSLFGCVIAMLLIVCGAYFISLNIGGERAMRSIYWAGCVTLAVIVLNFLITIPNGTTNKFFGSWYVYLTFLAMFVGVWLGIKGRK